MKKIIRLTESDLERIVKKIIKESEWDNLYSKSIENYGEFKRKSGDLDSSLFDELYDNLMGGQYFSFQNLKQWSDEDGKQLNKNENKIVESFPTYDTISSWREWVNSEWFETTHLAFSKKATKNPIKIYGGGKNGKVEWGEEPIERKKMYFDTYLKKFGPLVIKKK
jgi:hypothetical protein